MLEQMIFYGLAMLVTACSVAVITARHPVASAIFLVLDLFLLAAVFATLEAHFVAVIQIMLYAGAITVLFVFVIMLLNLQPDALRRKWFTPIEAGVFILTMIGFAVIAGLIATADPVIAMGPYNNDAIEAAGGNTYVVSMKLFTKFVWPFELASVLILLAIIASVVIARKQTPEQKSSRRAKPARS